MKYEQVWDAVDKLARTHGLSPSGLAKKAGLDATTFNKSKRIRADGKKRWPSLDSINKILDACNVTFEQFYSLIDEDLNPDLLNAVPYIKFSAMDCNLDIRDDRLNTDKWNRLHFPDTTTNLYAIDIDVTDFEPFYRAGSIIIATKSSEIRKGDRIVVIFKNGDILIKEFVHRTPSTLVLGDIANPQKEMNVNIIDIELVNRILWAGQ